MRESTVSRWTDSFAAMELTWNIVSIHSGTDQGATHRISSLSLSRFSSTSDAGKPFSVT